MKRSEAVIVKKYQLKVPPSFLAYWCEDDKRVRGRLERILNSFFKYVLY